MAHPAAIVLKRYFNCFTEQIEMHECAIRALCCRVIHVGALPGGHNVICETPPGRSSSRETCTMWLFVLWCCYGALDRLQECMKGASKVYAARVWPAKEGLDKLVQGE